MRKDPPKDTRFKPGNNANPGGRPKGLAAQIREATNQGWLLIEGLLKIQATGSEKGKIEATKILLDRGYGKSLEVTATLDLGGQATSAMRELTSETLTQIADALPKTAPADIDAQSPTVDALPSATSGSIVPSLAPDTTAEPTQVSDTLSEIAHGGTVGGTPDAV